MPRPTLLVAEQEPQQALSTRKLVLETGKFNVITAHSTQEALDLFHLFPNISVAVLAADPDHTIDCARIADAVKKQKQQIPVIALSPVVAEVCDYADQTISSHEPETLLHLIRSLVGDPRTIDGK